MFNGYNFINVERSNRTGGGLGIFHKAEIPVQLANSGETSSFEYAEFSILIGNFKLSTCVIYRPPYSDNHPVTEKTFNEEFSNYLESLLSSQERCLIVGDFNIHVNDTTDRNAAEFLEVLNTFSLTQLVDVPTHTSGNTLDLILYRESSDFKISDIRPDFYISDHTFVTANFSTCRPVLVKESVEFRRLRSIDQTSFRADLAKTVDTIMPLDDINQLVTAYNSELGDLLDRHAPRKTKIITVRKPVPWFTPEAQQHKTETRRTERQWRAHKTPENWHNFQIMRNAYKNYLNKCKSRCIEDKISACGNDTKQLFDAVSHLTGKNKNNPLPPNVTNDQLVCDFSAYFFDKVNNIRNDLSKYNVFVPPKRTVPCFDEFENVTVAAVSKIISKAKPATCELDPMPSSLVKEYNDIMAPVITKIINSSFSSGVFPTEWKNAIVKPLLKNQKLEHTLKNYRPVSNLSFLSKLVEKASAISFTKHLETNMLLPEYQSAYRSGFSTETLLLKLQNDILTEMENGRLSPLVAIDLSAAFDTVDHQLLLNILSASFGVTGNALQWIESYLSDRTFQVKIAKSKSKLIKIDFSVPQGSINGPIYFTCYASTLGSCIKGDQKLAGYADDHSIYDSYLAKNHVSEIQTIQNLSCSLYDIKDWMCSNRLKMNETKTEFIIFGSTRMLARSKVSLIDVCGTDIKRSEIVKLLGMHMDENLTLEHHISVKARSASAAMFNLKKLRPFLCKKSCLKITNALIMSHLDYCNSLLINLPECRIRPFQRIQNMTAKIILGKLKFDSSTQALKELHFLPIAQRSQYKILIMVFKCLHGLAPAYLSDLIKYPSTSYNTRSSTKSNLMVPFNRRRTFADRSFSSIGPTLWNALPENVKSTTSLQTFKIKLKTHLFTIAFPSVTH